MKPLQIIILSLFVVSMIGEATAQSHMPLKKPQKVFLFGNFIYADPANADFKSLANNGFGFELGAGIGSGKTKLMASIGEINYDMPEKKYTNYKIPSSNLVVIPFKIGLRRYLVSGLFVDARTGIVFQKQDYAAGNPSSGHSFLYELGTGFRFRSFEIGIVYSGFNKGTVGIDLPQGQYPPTINANSLLLKAGIAIRI